jgi:hypothetical protein
MSSTWVWAGAKAVGTSHNAQDVPCQDSYLCRIWQRGAAPPVLIAALADGAGSAECAEVGARLAVSLFTDIVSEALDEGATMTDAADIVRYAVRETRLALELKAGHDQRAISDYASTLLVAVLSPAGGVIGQIGDGAVVIDDGERGWRPVHWPDHGEYANTTSFLTQTDALDMLRIATFTEAVYRVAMFSDGLERLVLDFRSRTAHGPFFASIFRRLAPIIGAGHLAHVSLELAALLGSDQVNSRTDDDKSLLCAALIEV